MTYIEYEDLTPEQKDFLTDDCGKPGYLDVPDFVFEEACKRHDFDYWLGHTEEDRKIADLRMYDTMKAVIAEKPWYRRWYLYPIASTYYWAIRWFSAKYFYFGPRKSTLEDLEQEMEEWEQL